MLTSRLKSASSVSTLVPTLTYQTNSAINASQSTYNFNGISIGGAGLIVVTIHSERAVSSGTVSSATIGGVSATLHVNTTINTGYGGLMSAVISSGSTADISITFTQSQARTAIGVWRIQDYNSTTPLSSPNSNTSGATTGTSVTATSLQTNAVIVAGYTMSLDNNTVTWTNATSRYALLQIGGGSTAGYGADKTASSSSDITISTSHNSVTSNNILFCGAWF